MKFPDNRVFRFLRIMFYRLRLPRDKENMFITIENIRSGTVLTGVNLWVLVGAIFIASLGLNINSTAVIIGAMLISPLMGPITGFGLGLGINDFTLIKKALRNFTVMVLLSVATSTVFFLVSPVKEAGSELLGRTSPTIYDVLIAFFGGLAGIIAGASKLRRGNVIPGVAIATALMPPLCTMGYGISHLNLQYTAGAFYLFMINSVFIALATYLVVNLLRYPKVEEADEVQKKRLRIILPLIVTLMIAPSIYLTYQIVKKYLYTNNAQRFVKNEIDDGQHVVVSSKMNYKPRGSILEIVVVGEIYDSLQIETIKEKMKDYQLENCKLTLYQGADTRAATEGKFSELYSNVQFTQKSIKGIYLTIDSLQRKINKMSVMDTLQVNIARQMKNTDTTLNTFQLDRNISYNLKRNANDTFWYGTATFERRLTRKKRKELEEWLKARLKSENVQLLVR
jgi:uncharacterized hydrophobic protein (TIGR00271 family)